MLLTFLALSSSAQTSDAAGCGFDAIVDASFATDDTTTVPARFRSVQAAVSASRGTADDPWLIFVKAGTYHEHVAINKPYVHITGQNKNAVRIVDDKSIRMGGVDRTATVNVSAPDVVLDNLTLENAAGKAAGQALALYTKADRIVVTGCNLVGYQDTYRTGKNNQRHLVRNCKITGATDFVYNGGDVFFDADTLNLAAERNIAIVAPKNDAPMWGYVFRDAVITAEGLPSATTNLGRPWGDTPKVTFVNTRLAANVTVSAEGWVNMGGLPVRMADYNTTDADGRAVDLSARRTLFTAEGRTAVSQALLTQAEADSCTVDNVLHGSDGWDADSIGRILPPPTVSVRRRRARWTAGTVQPLCYLVVRDGVATLTRSTTCDLRKVKTVTIQAVSYSGVLGEPARLERF